MSAANWAEELGLALTGKESEQEIVAILVEVLKLGRPSAARELLEHALEVDAISRKEAARLLISGARESLGRGRAEIASLGRGGGRPVSVAVDELSSSGLSRWYRPEGELGVHLPNQLAESPFKEVDPACYRLVDRLAVCSNKSLLSDEMQEVIADSSFRNLFPSGLTNLVQSFSAQLEGVRVLELDCRGGAQARFLAERGAIVTAVTGNSEHALLTAALCSDLPNVQVILDAPELVPFRNTHDVVIISGYHERFVARSNVLVSLDHLLSRAHAALTLNGSLMISGHNALALRHFNDQRDVYGREGVAALEARVAAGAPQLLSSFALEKAITHCGFYRQEACAVIGPMQGARLIVSPRGCELPDKRWNVESLVRRALVDQDGDRLARFSESRVMHTILEGRELQDWSDGYLFLAHKSPEPRIRIDGWLASYFKAGGERAGEQELRFQLVQGSEGAIEVVNRSLNGLSHETVYPYINGLVHRDLLDDLMQVPGWKLEQALQWTIVWLRCLLSTLQSDAPLVREGNYAEKYAGDYDFWVPDRLLGALPERWIKTAEGGFECLLLPDGSGSTVPIAVVLYAGLTETLSTIGSVAEPADGTWLNPEKLTEVLMGRLGYELNPDDIETVKEHWQRVMERSLPKPRRLSPRQKPRALTDSAKLYWRTESEGFSESKTSTAKFTLDGSLQTLRLAIASPEEQLTGLRFDIANRPGCFEVEEMAVLQKGGEEVWRWHHSREELSGVQGATLVLDSESAQSCVLSRSNDPQFVLNLPQSALRAAKGGVFQIKLTAWPQRL